MSQTLKFGNGTWATKKGSTLAYNDEGGNFKPLPFTYTGAGKGTRVNKKGLIEVVENDRPRIDYTDSEDGVFLLEKASTNKITYSEDFSQSTWVKINSTIVSNQEISPDGTLNADKLNILTNTWLYSTSTAANGYYSVSIFAKAGDISVFKLGISDNVQAELIMNVDLSNETFTTEVGSSWTLEYAKIENYGNGWFRCSISGNNTVTSTSKLSLIRGVENGHIYIWGAQLESGNVASSYIPTEGTIQTRVAETASGSGNSEVFNDSEGVLMFEGSFSSTDLGTSVVAISDGSTSNRIILGYIGTSNDLYCQSIGGASAPSSMSFSVTDITLNNKIIIKYKANDFSFWVNGFVVGARTSGTTPSNLNNLSFDSGTGSSNLYGKTKEISYYDEILTDLELETLTSYRTWEAMVKELNLNVIYNG